MSDYDYAGLRTLLESIMELLLLPGTKLMRECKTADGFVNVEGVITDANVHWDQVSVKFSVPVMLSLSDPLVTEQVLAIEDVIQAVKRYRQYN